MRVLFWYCDRFEWKPVIKTLENAPDAGPGRWDKAVVAFIHVEPDDTANGSPAETRLVKNAKWLARKWEVSRILFHSFTHLGEEKAAPEDALSLMDRAEARLKGAGYETGRTPYGYFNDLSMDAPGHPLARVYKEF